MELKLVTVTVSCASLSSSNRTFMELKSKGNDNPIIGFYRSNRTFMELKLF